MNIAPNGNTPAKPLLKKFKPANQPNKQKTAPNSKINLPNEIVQIPRLFGNLSRYLIGSYRMFVRLQK